MRYIYYRYTYEGIGIYEALKRVMTYKEWSAAKTDGTFNWLPVPNVYALNSECKYESYFTIEGNKLFEDNVIPIIGRHLDSNKVKMQICDSLSDDVVYEDKYQIVVEKSHRNKSTI